MKESERTTAVTPWRNASIFCALSIALLWIPFFGWHLSGNDEWKAILGVLGPYSPLLAAIIVRTLIAREGFRDAHLSFRVTHWRYWGIALLLPFFWNSAQDAFQIVFGYASMDWSRFAEGLYRVPINLFGGLLIFIGEEFGWRSYLLEKLRGLGRMQALALTSVVWALWHIPFVFVPNPQYGQQVGGAGALIALFVFVLMGFIFGWLYFASGSVWPCVLLHSFNNLISLKLFREGWHVNADPSLLQSSLFALVPIAIIWFFLFVAKEFRDGATEVGASGPASIHS